jgi:hypothetical protein
LSSLLRIADPIVLTEPRKSADTGTLSTEPISIAMDAATLTTKPIRSGEETTVPTDSMLSGPDDNIVQSDAISSAAATSTVSNDKSIVGERERERAILPKFWKDI